MIRLFRFLTARAGRAAVAAALILAVLLSGSAVAAIPETVTVTLAESDGTVLMSRVLPLAGLAFVLDPYVTATVTDITDTTPSALHALIGLLEAEGEDATDPTVLSAVDSAYGIYVDSILGSASPFYWAFQVDGTDSWTGVFAHKLAPGETISFIRTEYIPTPTPPPAFVHPESGLPAQTVDIEGALAVSAAGLAGTVNDWAILDLARYGLVHTAGRDAWLAAAYTRLTARRVTTTDLELIAMVLTAFGIDPRGIRVDGMATDLMARIAAAEDMDTYGFIFGLAAFDCAAFPDVAGARNTRASMVDGLLAARLPDGGWSWAPTEAISDTDTTAMAVSVLARYAAGDPDVAAAITGALALLSGWQAADGTMGSSNATAMVLLALAATGADGRTDTRFADAGGNLLDGMFRYRTPDGRFGYQNTVYDAFATEQAFRALVVYQDLMAEGTPQSAYELRSSTAGLESGIEIPGGIPVADTGEGDRWPEALGMTLLGVALSAALTVPTLRRRRCEA